MQTAESLRDPQTYAIIGAAMEVHTQLGPGFLEAVYHEAICWELRAREIPFRTEVPLPVYFKQTRLTSSFRADLVCFDGLLVELKATAVVANVEVAQVINYLRAANLSRGLLLNFGARSLQFRRLVL